MIRLSKGAGWPILTPRDTPAFDHVADAYPMPSVALGQPPVSDGLYHGFEDVDVVPQELYEKYDVKRGLRNADGSGVLVGLTTISNVHGYNRTDHGIEPDDGRLIYRGYDVDQLIDGAQAEDRFGYEEVAYLLISGRLPTREELDDFCARIDARKQLPEGYSMAETVLDVLRSDEGFSHEEAMLLDVMLILHAEHGGGNNSTFTTRVLSSSGTDAYSAYAAAIGSLKGPKHGGANFKAGDMIEDVAAHVRDWSNDDEVADYLAKILRKEAFDGAGLLYGLGHAVYTKTDPRAEIIRGYARRLAEEKGQVEKLDLIASIERLGPQVMRDVRGITKPISTNIDMYTGFVYSMLGIPQDLFTPIFAMARLAGWTAHRMEELYGAGRIIRPAYNSVMPNGGEYVPLDER